MSYKKICKLYLVKYRLVKDINSPDFINYVLNLKNMRDKRVWSNFDNTAFFIKVFCEAFGKSNAYFCSKPLSVNLSGVREWSDLYPLVEIVRLPEALDYYRSRGLGLFQYIYSKNYSMRNFFNFFF